MRWWCGRRRTSPCLPTSPDPSAPLEPWERRARLAAAEPKEQPEVSERTALRERLVRLEVAVPTEEQPAPGAHWVLLEQLVVSVPRECLAQLELAVRMAQRERWGLRVSEVRWGPPVYQGRKEPLEQPVASVRTESRERVPPTVFEVYSVLRARLAQQVLRERWVLRGPEVRWEPRGPEARWGPTAGRGPAESLSGQIVQRALPRKTRWRPAGGEACRGKPSRAGRAGRRRGRWLGAA